MKTFAITGFGRSGTTFLARVMNLSSVWTVEHEPRGAFDEDAVDHLSKCQPLPNSIMEAFNRDYYGEVNSRLRFWFEKLPVEKKGIIIRNPKEVVISIANRNYTLDKIETTIKKFGFYYNTFHFWLRDTSILKIDFSRMTNDTIYMENILDTFDIYDVNISEYIIKRKINETKNRKYKNIDQFPSILKNAYYSINWQ